MLIYFESLKNACRILKLLISNYLLLERAVLWMEYRGTFLFD